jgi:hypothetical protein
MDEVLGRSKLLAPPGESVRLPVAHMVCNQTPPVGDQPSLMTFREVETLFHEFGHALQVGFTEKTKGYFFLFRDPITVLASFLRFRCVTTGAPSRRSVEPNDVLGCGDPVPRAWARSLGGF